MYFSFQVFFMINRNKEQFMGMICPYVYLSAGHCDATYQWSYKLFVLPCDNFRRNERILIKFRRKAMPIYSTSELNF
jgi:hypothetical protein